MTASASHISSERIILNSGSSYSNFDSNAVQQSMGDPPNRSREAGEEDSLSLSSSSSSSSASSASLDDSMDNGDIDRQDDLRCVNNIKKSTKNKRVSWDRIITREYSLVVGDHPMCQDGLPVSLGWQYNDHSCSTKSMNPQVPTVVEQKEEGTSLSLVGIQRQQQQELQQQQQQPIKLSERRQSYVFPRRLSYEERRERLISVSNLTLDQIKNDEIDLVVRTLKESWEEDDNQEGVGDGDGEGNDIMMEPANRDYDPLADENMMDLDDMDVVPVIDVDFNDNEDLGDITNFEWTDDDKSHIRTTDPTSASRL